MGGIGYRPSKSLRRPARRLPRPFFGDPGCVGYDAVRIECGHGNVLFRLTEADALHRPSTSESRAGAQVPLPAAVALRGSALAEVLHVVVLVEQKLIFSKVDAVVASPKELRTPLDHLDVFIVFLTLESLDGSLNTVPQGP